MPPYLTLLGARDVSASSPLHRPLFTAVRLCPLTACLVFGAATLHNMAPMRVMAWDKNVEKGAIPQWLIDWQVECEAHECNELPNYKKMRQMLARSVLEVREE